MRVRAPNEEYSGRIGRDMFVDGVCDNASAEQLWYYRRCGFTIEEQHVAEPSAPVEPPPEYVSTQEWKNFLDSVGITYPEKARRSELIALWKESHATVSSQPQ